MAAVAKRTWFSATGLNGCFKVSVGYPLGFNSYHCGQMEKAKKISPLPQSILAAVPAHEIIYHYPHARTDLQYLFQN
jgi:hypothetical protein